MAVNNKIAKKTLNEEANSKVVEYKVGEEKVTLSPSIIKNYLVRGGGNVTDQEVVMFLNLCRFQHLNPFLNEAYLIKFGNQAATIVVGKEAMTKRAMRHPSYAGQQAGVIVRNKETYEVEQRIGSMVVSDEELLGGWAKVYVKGFEVPIEITVGLDEYIGTKGDGSVNSQWAKKPGTMIRKVALMQALREAFPDDLGGMYDSAEMGLDIDETTMAPVDMTTQEPVQVNFPKAVDAKEPYEEQGTIEELPQF